MVECGGVCWSVVECDGELWKRAAVEYGGVWLSAVEYREYGG